MSIAATTLVLRSHPLVSASPLNKLVRHAIIFIAHLTLWNGLKTFCFDYGLQVWWKRRLAGRPVSQNSFTHSTPVHFLEIGDVNIVMAVYMIIIAVPSRVLVDFVLQQNKLVIGYGW